MIRAASELATAQIQEQTEGGQPTAESEHSGDELTGVLLWLPDVGETIFARGILHFELAAHFPHPPGFPGWLAYVVTFAEIGGGVLLLADASESICRTLV